jgi:hypothetical protein
VSTRTFSLIVAVACARSPGYVVRPGRLPPQAAARPRNQAALLRPVVEVEEEVYRYEPADNGAGPLWCSGSTCLVRIGGEVFASGLETPPGVPPLNNCRWLLFRRGARGRLGGRGG